MKQFLATIVLTILLFSPFSQTVDLELRRFYRIQNNADMTVLTVAGHGHIMENGKIVTQDSSAYVRDPKLQSFWIGSRVGIDQSIYEISPSSQNTAISLVLEEDTTAKLLFQQIRHFRNTQWWKIVDAGDGTWQIINDNSNSCLASRGSGMQVGSETCDFSVKNQSWTFTIERKGDSFP